MKLGIELLRWLLKIHKILCSNHKEKAAATTFMEQR